MSTHTNPNEFPFTIGETDFAAVRVATPVAHWQLKVVETGEMLVPGTAGIRMVSLDGMRKGVEALLDFENGDVDLFRRGFKLPPRLERIRTLADHVGVEAEDDEERGTWSCIHDGREQHHFPTEAAALLAGIRASEALADFMLTAPSYRREDDTFLLVYAERHLDHVEEARTRQGQAIAA